MCLGTLFLMHSYVERLVDLTCAADNDIHNLSLEDARDILLRNPAAAASINGSFAIVAKSGKTVRMARSLDRPLRYFLAKRQEGPALIVAQRIDQIFEWLKREALDDQFHPSYTRMVPAHHVVEVELIGCRTRIPRTRGFSIHLWPLSRLIRKPSARLTWQHLWT